VLPDREYDLDFIQQNIGVLEQRNTDAGEFELQDQFEELFCQQLKVIGHIMGAFC